MLQSVRRCSETRRVRGREGAKAADVLPFDTGHHVEPSVIFDLVREGVKSVSFDYRECQSVAILERVLHPDTDFGTSLVAGSHSLRKRQSLATLETACLRQGLQGPHQYEAREEIIRLKVAAA